MVEANAMQERNNCYVKVVEENYYDIDDECTYPKIYLIFRSKRDYNKINEIVKMIEKYHLLEEDKGEKDFFLYYYLKK